MKKKFKYDKEGFCTICWHFKKDCDSPHYCEVYNDTLIEVKKEIEKLYCKVPKKPSSQKGFIYGLTDKWINKVILYAGRFNYNKAIDDVIKLLK